MKIGEVAQLAGVTRSAIRYYERTGVLSTPARTAAGYRDYDPSIVGQLRFVKAGQAFGLTLAELREIIAFRERGTVPCVHVIDLIRRRAAEIGAQIESLKLLREDLELLSARAEHLDPSRCSADSICQVIVEPELLRGGGA